MFPSTIRRDLPIPHSPAFIIWSHADLPWSLILTQGQASALHCKNV